MANESFVGKLFYISTDTIELFGKKLAVFGYHHVGGRLGGLFNDVEVMDIWPMTEIVEELISRLQSEQMSQVDHLLLVPMAFQCLYLEGTIAFEKMAMAIEDEAAQSVSVSGVIISGRSFTIKTMPEALIYERYGKGRGTSVIDAQGGVIMSYQSISPR